MSEQEMYQDLHRTLSAILSTSNSSSSEHEEAHEASEQKQNTNLETAANYVDDLMDIPEEYLPDVLYQRIEKLKEIHSAYEKAKQAAATAESASKTAVRQADALCKKAEKTGNHQAKIGRLRNFFKMPPKTKEQIAAMQENIADLVALCSDSVDLQDALVAVQAAFAVSQTALLGVQAKQMEYERQIADVSKYLFGLSAKNMADANSVLIELNARLEGASEEEIGEMAKQQLLAAMDQLKSQENIKNRLTTTEENISDQSKRLDDIESVDETQNAELFAQAQQNKQQDDELARQAEKDAEHDEKLAQQAEKDAEHDKLLSQLAANIETHDERFAQQELVNAEHDRLLAQQEEKDLDHDRRLDEQAEALKEHGERLNDLERRADEHDSALAQHGTDIAGNTDTIQEQAALIVQLNEEISALKLALETKASKKADLVSLILAGASLLGVIIHFCI